MHVMRQLSIFSEIAHIDEPTQTCKMLHDWIFLEGKGHKNNIDGSTS